MANQCCIERCSCVLAAVIASIILGIVTAFLSISGIITVTTVFLWVTFGIAVVYLAITPVTTALIRSPQVRGCLCSVLPALLIGILGTILLSVVLLAITVAATSVIGAILNGLLLAFFTLTLASTACLAKCAAKCPNNSYEL